MIIGEIKSMHTAESVRGRGVEARCCATLLQPHAEAAWPALSLETGSWDYFKPARALYRSHGFVECPPFSDYVGDPNSVFMSLDLRNS